MTRSRRIAAPIALLAGAGLLLVGCTPATSESTDTIRTTIDIPTGFDPSLSLALPDYVLAHASFDTLVHKDADGAFASGLATKWETSPLGATFTIRNDATCSDGTPITPTIVKNSLDYLARDGSGSSSVPVIFGGNKPAITADDAAGTVKIELQSPWPYLISGLTIGAAGIICPAGLADPQGLAAGSVKGAESGPYIQTAAESGVKYTYTLRSDYKTWPGYATAPGGVPAKTIEYIVSPDSSATSNLVLSGGLDIAKIQAESIARFDGQADYSVQVNRFSDFYVVFNERDTSPFKDQALRTAVAQVIDRAALAKVTSLDTAEVTSQMVSKSIPCAASDDAATIAYAPDAAAGVLKGVTIRLVGPQIAGPNGAGNEYLQEVLRAAGATVELTNTDVGTWISTVYGQPDAWDMTLFADLNFVGSMASPQTLFRGPAILDGGSNVGAVSNPKFETAFDAALLSTDPKEVCQLQRDAADALIARADAVSLINDAFIYVQRAGFQVTLLGGSLDDPILRITK